MKKILLTLAIQSFLISIIFGQKLVSTEKEYKNAVLEEFTGIYCGFCPRGHATAEELREYHSGKFICINIHQGFYANPGAGKPDFRTEFGDALAAQAGIKGYPSGTVNRHDFGNGNTSLGRRSWAFASNVIMQEYSPVNIGIESSIDSSTRELTVNVELYYTSDSPKEENFLNIALIQDKIYGPQANGGAGDNYEHNHMLRHLITGQWGDTIKTTKKGDFIQKTYKYIIPKTFNYVEYVLENCSVVAFVTETKQEIYSGEEVAANGGTTIKIGSIQSDKDLIFGEPSGRYSFDVEFSNALEESEEFEFEISNISESDSWGKSIIIGDNTFENKGSVTIESGSTEKITVKITPDNTPGFKKYLFVAKSKKYSKARALTKTFYVISNVKDLLIHNKGLFSGRKGKPKDFENDFFQAFEEAGMKKYTSCNYNMFLIAGKENILNTFDNLYFNAAWTFPSLTDQNTEYFKKFIDNGGNLFISGQDIGWATWGAKKYFTENTRKFYTDYLGAEFISDGSNVNNKITPNINDEIFGTVPSSELIPVYKVDDKDNMFPDELKPLEGAVAMLHYNGNTDKAAAIRNKKGDAKIVYFGFEPSMIEDVDVRNKLLKTINNWFEGTVKTEDFNIESNIKIYPNPISDVINIELLNNNSNVKITMYDVAGNKVMSKKYSSKDIKSNKISIGVNNLKVGIYSIIIDTKDFSSSKKIFINK